MAAKISEYLPRKGVIYESCIPSSRMPRERLNLILADARENLDHIYNAALSDNAPAIIAYRGVAGSFESRDELANMDGIFSLFKNSRSRRSLREFRKDYDAFLLDVMRGFRGGNAPLMSLTIQRFPSSPRR